MKNNDIPKTAFKATYGNCEFRVMSCGLTNTPVAFVDFMNSVFQIYPDSFVIVFIEDIFVYLKNENEHVDHLRVVLKVLTEHKFFFKV